MKKFFSFIIALSLVAVCSTSYALTNWGEDDLNRQLKNTFNNHTTPTTDSGSQIGGVTATGDLGFRTNLIANGRYGAASTVLFSSSTTFILANIPYALVLKAILGVEQDTLLPAGTPGQEVVFQVYSVGQSGTWKIKPDVNAVTPVNSTGWTSIQFTAKGQGCKLLYLNDTLGWIIENTFTTSSSASPVITAPTLN